MSVTEPPEESPEEPKGSHESADSQRSPETNTGFGKDDRKVGIVGLVVGVAALLAALVVFNFRSLVLWAVLMVAVATACVPLIKGLRKRKYITQVYALLCAFLMIVLYGSIASRDNTSVKAEPAPVASKAKPVPAASAARPSIEIDSPLPNSSVARCVKVSGQAELPTGDVIWVLVQGMSPTLYYPEGQASTSPSHTRTGWVDWNFAPAKIGKQASSANFKIYAVVVDSTTSNFMTGLEDTLPGKDGTITYKADINTQGDQNLPLEITDDHISVTRNPKDVGDCG